MLKYSHIWCKVWHTCGLYKLLSQKIHMLEPDLSRVARRGMGYPDEFEFQINNKNPFSIKYIPQYYLGFATISILILSLFIIFLKFKFNWAFYAIMVNLATLNLKFIWRSRSCMDQTFGWVVEAETPFLFSSIWLLGILTFFMSGVLKWILT